MGTVKVILDACFEIPKLEDSILHFQMLLNIRNMEPKCIRRTCLWSVTLRVGDVVLIWMLTPANNSKSDRLFCIYAKLLCEFQSNGI